MVKDSSPNNESIFTSLRLDNPVHNHAQIHHISRTRRISISDNARGTFGIFSWINFFNTENSCREVHDSLLLNALQKRSIVPCGMVAGILSLQLERYHFQNQEITSSDTAAPWVHTVDIVRRNAKRKVFCSIPRNLQIMPNSGIHDALIQSHSLVTLLRPCDTVVIRRAELLPIPIRLCTCGVQFDYEHSALGLVRRFLL